MDTDRSIEHEPRVLAPLLLELALRPQRVVQFRNLLPPLDGLGHKGSDNGSFGAWPARDAVLQSERDPIGVGGLGRRSIAANQGGRDKAKRSDGDAGAVQWHDG